MPPIHADLVDRTVDGVLGKTIKYRLQECRELGLAHLAAAHGKVAVVDLAKAAHVALDGDVVGRVGENELRFGSFEQAVMQNIGRYIGWLLILTIVIFSVVPPSACPVTFAPSWLEHFGLFLMTGAAFAVGYWGRRWLQMVVFVAFAGLIESAPADVAHPVANLFLRLPGKCPAHDRGRVPGSSELFAKAHPAPVGRAAPHRRNREPRSGDD